jgi:hypothetical protein
MIEVQKVLERNAVAISCKQLKVKHAPDLKTRFQKLYEPACVLLDTEFDLNTFGTSFIYTKFKKMM